MSESMREEFEAWYRIEFPALELRAQNLIGTYTKYHADLSWQAWQASRAALCVELPVVADYIDLHLQGMNAKVYNEALTEAIHAAGVKTK